MADADFSGILNPKRVIEKRLQQADPATAGRSGNAAQDSPAVKPPVDFMKAFSDEEKARQRAQLAALLAKRDGGK